MYEKSIYFFYNIFNFLFQLFSFNAKAQSGANDPTFNPTDIGFGFGDGASDMVNTTAIQSDGKIIIGGSFIFYDGTSLNHIARLNTDGTFDASFNLGTGADNLVNTIAIQSDGKIIIGGNFASFNGTARNHIARLNADGTLDTTFNPSIGANNSIRTTTIQSDGKIIIGGDFTSYNGIPVNYIARLNADGMLDSTFNSGTGASSTVSATTTQNDGKIIIGGWFTTYNGFSINHIARLNTDGSLDATFNTGAGVNNAVNSIAIQNDGKIIIGGQFISYNGYQRNYIARINPDGSIDPTFNTGAGANSYVYTTAIQSDGRIIIGGQFTTYNGTTRNHIARLNADGTIDATFNPGTGANNVINTTDIQSDGKIIIGGQFTFYNETPRNRISRLNADGTIDPTFNTGTGAINSIVTTAIQSDSKIIIGGGFSSFNGVTINRIARLNIDGTLDPTFNPGMGANNWIEKICIQSDGKIIIVGGFTYFNGTPRNRIARLNADGTIDATFNPGTGANNMVNTTALQSDGRIIIGGDFTSYNGTQKKYIARLKADGTLDATFNSGVGANNFVQTITIQSDGKIIIGGYFNSYNGFSRNYIARLNADGTLEANFNAGSGASSAVNTTTIQSDDKIIIGGNFTSFNNTTINRFARLNSDGTLDTTFNPGTGANNPVRTTSIQSNGKIVIGGDFNSYNEVPINYIARINTDGTLDTTFNTGTGANRPVCTTAIQSDGKIIIGGNFTSYNGTGRNRVARIINLISNGISSIQQKEAISLYPNPVSNQITIENPLQTKDAIISIYNVQGQLLLQQKMEQEKTEINVGSFAKGIYIVKLNNDENIAVTRFVKE